MAKLGRALLALDGHRMPVHVGTAARWMVEGLRDGLPDGELRENLGGKLGVAEVLDNALVVRPYLRIEKSPERFVTLPGSTPRKLMAYRSLNLRQQQLRPHGATQRASLEAGILASGLRVRLGFAKHVRDVGCENDRADSSKRFLRFLSSWPPA